MSLSVILLMWPFSTCVTSVSAHLKKKNKSCISQAFGKRLQSKCFDNAEVAITATHLFLPYLKRLAADAVQNRQESALECVFEHLFCVFLVCGVAGVLTLILKFWIHLQNFKMWLQTFGVLKLPLPTFISKFSTSKFLIHKGYNQNFEVFPFVGT